ncbi:MAG: hypothetical protein DMF80_03740 [Acidobacteria bacterium]|nr:MAG: hypothetical protein DMF80_03740 [Acidobacteriota bacterium]
MTDGAVAGRVSTRNVNGYGASVRADRRKRLEGSGRPDFRRGRRTDIRAFDFKDYDGARTPVYPLLLALLPGNLDAIWLVQSVLGIATSVLLYLVVARCPGSERMGLIAGLAHALSFNHIAFESAVVAEALATFLIALAVWRAHRLQLGPLRRGEPLLLGLVCAVAALTRPMYVVLGLAVGLYLLRLDMPRRLTAAAVFASAMRRWRCLR